MQTAVKSSKYCHKTLQFFNTLQPRHFMYVNTLLDKRNERKYNVQT